MFDTMYIFYQVTKAEYNELFIRLNQMSYSINGKKLFPAPNDKNSYVTYCHSINGLQEIKLRYNREKSYRAIEILLRPKLLIDKGNYFDTIRIDEFEEARLKFKMIMGEFEFLPDLLHWRVKRIDPAVDLHMDEELILTYLFLFKKSNIPSYMLMDKRTKLYTNSNHNFYVCSEKVTMNFYSRYKVLSKKIEEGLIPEINIEPIKDTLRIEIQYKNCNGELYQFLDRDFSRNKILTFFDLVIGEGDYYALNDAIEIISKNEKSNLKRIKLTKLIKSINEKGSIYEAKSQFIRNNNDPLKARKEFSSLIQRMRKMNLNPVTIPSGYKLKRINGIRELITQKFTKENQQAYL